MANLITTDKKAISCVSGKTNQEFEEVKDAFEKTVGKIVTGSAKRLMILNLVLKELPKLKKGKGIGFDFGNKKEFKLNRVK